MDRKLKSLFVLCILVSISLQAQKSALGEKLIPVKELQKDLAILKKNLEKVHPGLYTYTSKEEMDRTFLHFKNAIVQPMTDVNFYRLLLPLHDKIKNGHTFLIPPASWSVAVETQLPHFPFDVYQHDERLYILRNLSHNQQIQAGSELLSINGKPAIEVFRQLVTLWTKDGDKTTFPGEIVQHDFSEFYVNVLGAFDHYQIQVRQQENTQDYQVAGLLIAEIRKICLERYQEEKRPWYNDVESPPPSLRVEDNIGILYLPSFDLNTFKDQKIDYRQFFKKVFTQVQEKKIQELVIDIRDNGGGHGDVVTELFSYLYDQPFRLLKEMHAVTRKIPNKKYYEGNQFFLNMQLGLALKKIAPNKYIPKKAVAKRNHLSLTAKTPSLTAYQGKLYVLIGGWSFSASGMFTSLLKTYQKGIFIGEEAGGNPHTQVGDFEQMLVLPHSKVRIRIPLLVQYMAVNFDNSRHGVLPKYERRNTIEEAIKREDGVLTWTLDFIKGNR